MLAPGFLALDHILSMNAFEPLLWMGCALVVIRIIRTGKPQLWIWFGLLAGIGLENKHSMLIFGFGLVAGLLLTRERRILDTRWLWIGGLLAFLIFLPNLIWNIQHHFPFLELQANIRRSGRDVPLSPFDFFGQEILAMLPLTLPIWIAGLWYLFFNREGRTFRALGWAWVITAGIIVALNPRIYYLFPAYPMLFAAGGVAWERWLAVQRWQWIKPVYASLMILMGALLAPTLVPLLPARDLHPVLRDHAPPAAAHRDPPARAAAATVRRPVRLAGNGRDGRRRIRRPAARRAAPGPRSSRRTTARPAPSISSARNTACPRRSAAIRPTSSGDPADYTGESVIVMAGRQQSLEREYAAVSKVARVEHPYSMPYEHFDVFYCQNLKHPVSEVWPHVKNWD